MSLVMPVSAKRLLAAAATLAIALPALAQDRPESILPPDFGSDVILPPPLSAPPSSGQPVPPDPPLSTSDVPVEVTELLPDEEEVPPPPPPVELPAHSRRNPFFAGTIDSAVLGLGEAPWGNASGAFLATLLRRMDTPLASRWAHIALRRSLIATAAAPRNVNPVDWTAERVWLLLRLGEADAARLLSARVDVDRFTPKMFQIGVQSALASGDPSALCPLEEGIAEVEARIAPLVRAMCAAMTGSPETAAADIEAARRRGRIQGIDLVLADKVVGAGADTARAVTIEWEPVERLTAWRFGLATATGIELPDRLLSKATPQLRAWQARSPLLSAEARLPAARIATGLGVFSSSALTDLYSTIYDMTDPDELGQTDAWRLRTAFIGRNQASRLGAMRRLWATNDGSLEREASRALLARAATRIAPDPALQGDAAELIASMLAGGFDREAAQWTAAVLQMDDAPADACWAMLALSSPKGGVDTSFSRINAFIGRDQSQAKVRSALLVAGLAALGRIDGQTAARLNSRHDLRIDRPTLWTRMIDAAAKRGQAGTVNILAAAGMQTSAFKSVPASQLLHAVAAMRLTGQEFAARMIAAEALSRT